MNPSVAIIILNWNNAPDTLACLESVFQMDYPNFSVLVVDNGSTDDSVDRIRAAYPNVEILETGENLGYAEGNNIGIRHALDGRPYFILVLNNDTLVQPNLLVELVREAERSIDIGMVGPKMYFFDPPDMIFAAGSMIDWHRGELVHRGIWQRESQEGSLFSEHAEDVDFIAGCAMLVRRQVIEDIGMLDPSYYLNFEDVEWCVRAKKAGFRICYTPSAILYHKVSATMGQASPMNTYYMTRNSMLFFWRNAEGVCRYTSLILTLMRTLRTIGAWSIKPVYRNKQYRRKLKANIFALRDFFLRRFGRMGEDVARVCYPT
ncbi:MAG: glycosyltransferase family 2 protein [Candidatus Promineofilum sp.]|nr:glycosyltransferase family 2 protein [Promineifilum sp.]